MRQAQRRASVYLQALGSCELAKGAALHYFGGEAAAPPDKLRPNGSVAARTTIALHRQIEGPSSNAVVFLHQHYSRPNSRKYPGLRTV
ncbi:uncharacterized protein RHO25_009812 [Cercospora beticola]|uniref:Uncharacterized protein n=1 Tax=Cercospora beticola TaxID=122368 RepID=A0ABZ0P0D8_CERBT|nr:hypothetical protein RHO25_009812 [Cercospora beticola]